MAVHQWEFGNSYHDKESAWEDYDYSHSQGNQAPPRSGISEPDYLLGIKGIQLGSKIRDEYLDYYQLYGGCPSTSPIIPLSFKPGDWIRNNLKY